MEDDNSKSTQPDKLDKAREEQDKKVQESSEQVSRGLNKLLQDSWLFLKHLLSLREETDYEKTREGIIKDVPFRGHTVYILICSIFIASIGLNLNSPAVIIGAMLIAPLMGPILGIGLAVGTNDGELFGKSLKNFGVMVFISLVTSTIYFFLTPLVEYQPELLARTKPTTLDIFVAIFGGAAGIIAGSRKEKSNVIPGVAIATALMPPLCTSGFGLATGNWPFFFGAFYLFLLNSIFIFGATVVGVRYLRFPLRKFVSPERERKTKLGLGLFMTILILPSLWIFWGVIQESWFRSRSEKYINEVITMDEGSIYSRKFMYNDSMPTIEVFMSGVNIPNDTVAYWQSKLGSFGLEKCQLKIYDNADDFQEPDVDALTGQLQETLRLRLLEDIYSKEEEKVADRDEKIRILENKLFELQKNEIQLESISKELKIQFEKLEKLSYANTIEFNEASEVDTIPTFLVKWNKKAPSKECRKNEAKIADLMKVRLKLDTVRVITYRK